MVIGSFHELYGSTNELLRSSDSPVATTCSSDRSNPGAHRGLRGSPLGCNEARRCRRTPSCSRLTAHSVRPTAGLLWRRPVVRRRSVRIGGFQCHDVNREADDAHDAMTLKILVGLGGVLTTIGTALRSWLKYRATDVAMREPWRRYVVRGLAYRVAKRFSTLLASRLGLRNYAAHELMATPDYL